MGKTMQTGRAAILGICLLSCWPLAAVAEQDARVRESTKEFTTYPFSDPDPVADPGARIYPYFRYDGFTDKPLRKTWKVVELENDYIKLTIMPEIGGKIWSAIDKRTGKPFIYDNEVVKFRDIAMRGPWTSGGIEANFGIMGHTPNTATPVDYVTIKRADGSVSCVIGGLDLITQTRWRLDINLPKDKAYFTTSPFWYNATPLEEPYYTWMNAAIKARGNLRYVYPGQNILGHDGEIGDWPVNKGNGKDVSLYENNDFGGYKSYHVFGKYSDFFGAYWQDEDFGMGHYASHADSAGKKIWIWGLSPQGAIWEHLLTDSDGQYTEVQSGRLFNQTSDKSTFSPFKHQGFAPYASDAWTEYWFPVNRTKGFVAANNYGALNLAEEGGQRKIYLYALQRIDEELKVGEAGRTIYSKALHLKPGDVFTDILPASGAGASLRVTLGDAKLVYDASPAAADLHRPLAMPADFDWNSPYGLYTQAKENIRERNYAQAENKLAACLEKDPNYLPALADLAALQYRDLRYAAALQTARRALSIDTYDPAANFAYGLINAKLGNIADAMDGFDIAAMSVTFRSAALTELAQMHLRQADTAKAEEFAKRALLNNPYDMDALQTLAVAYRLRGSEAGAKATLERMLSLDPLSHFARFEQYLWHRSSAAKSAFLLSIRNELPEQTYLDLADWYFRAGQRGAALTVLYLAPQHAEVQYWEAFLANKPLEAKRIELDDALPVLPFRAETRDILEHLIEGNDDWRLKYHLALIEWSRNNIERAKQLFAQIGDKPDYAPFYASRAKLFKDDAEVNLKQALKLDPNQWRYVKALGELYLERNAADEALALVEPFYRSHRENTIVGMLYAKSLLGSQRYAETDVLLSGLNILPFEGATDGIALYRESKLMQAVTEMKRHRFDLALTFIDAARVWPANLGVGKGYPADVDERLEDWLSYLCHNALGEKPAAEAQLNKLLAFAPKVENTVRNYQPANHLLTALALKAEGRNDEALRWLEQWQRREPDERLYHWCRTVYETGNASESDGAAKDGSARVINALLRVR